MMPEIIHISQELDDFVRLVLVRHRNSHLTRRIVMKVFAIGSFAKPITDEERQQIMRKEVPDTLKLYLEGKIEQFWFREDRPGVIFLMNTESLDQAKTIIHELPLAANGFLGFEFIPVGPLKPLGLLIQGK
jgi:hypothetical protein